MTSVIEFIFGIVSAIFLIFAVLSPGLVPTSISGTFGSGRRGTVVNSISTLFIYATLSYLTLAVIYDKIDKEFPLPILGTDYQSSIIKSDDQTQNTSSESVTSGILESFNFIESLDDIAWAILIAILFLWFELIIYRNRYIARLLIWLRLTEHFSERDLWTRLLTRGFSRRKFVKITDTAKRLVFTGWVEGFSEYDDSRELHLSEVEVYDFDDLLVSKSETTYLALPKDSIWIDFLTVKRRKQDANS